MYLLFSTLPVKQKFFLFFDRFFKVFLTYFAIDAIQSCTHNLKYQTVQMIDFYISIAFSSILFAFHFRLLGTSPVLSKDYFSSGIAEYCPPSYYDNDVAAEVNITWYDNSGDDGDGVDVNVDSNGDVDLVVMLIILIVHK